MSRPSKARVDSELLWYKPCLWWCRRKVPSAPVSHNRNIWPVSDRRAERERWGGRWGVRGRGWEGTRGRAGRRCWVWKRRCSNVQNACFKKCAVRGRMLNPGSAALGTKILGGDTSLTLGRQGCDPRSLSCFTFWDLQNKSKYIRDERESFQNILKRHLEGLSATWLKRLLRMPQESFSSVNTERNFGEEYGCRIVF